ncbi:DUF4442 domain-containing protein [Pseudaquidulcibacter saccharophilus]|uniref:DUF4442 domain-containing protein n=1 Tax=Pseudaquidulcibacter saccharophilus TaxID=2831900 RepID=UPI001EFF4778|nr:DUF4442 domain-containing protein [Pseudaquidulcibacter saccharophilus]
MSVSKANICDENVLAADVRPRWLRKIPPSLRTFAVKLGFNFHPAFLGAGGHVDYVSEDLSQIRMRLPLNWRTKNMVGSLFGGSLFAITDGVHMAMLSLKLGREYIIWDRSAKIRFLKPGFCDLYAEFTISKDEISSIRAEVVQNGEIKRNYLVELKDKSGSVYAIVEREIYIANKEFHKNKQNLKKATNLI